MHLSLRDRLFGRNVVKVSELNAGDGGDVSCLLANTSTPGCHNLSATHAIEGGCFVVLASSFYTKAGIERMKLGDGKLYHIGGGGCARIIGPDGRSMTEDLGEEEEGLVIADLDFDELSKTKAMLDVHGHYSRPDLLWLGVDYREKKQVRAEVDGERAT